MTLDVLMSKLAAGREVFVGTAAWEGMLPSFEILESHVTGAGNLMRLLHRGEQWAVVESLDVGRQDVHPFSDRASAVTFLRRRQDAFRHYRLGYG